MKNKSWGNLTAEEVAAVKAAKGAGHAAKIIRKKYPHFGKESELKKFLCSYRLVRVEKFIEEAEEEVKAPK